MQDKFKKIKTPVFGCFFINKNSEISNLNSYKSYIFKTYRLKTNHSMRYFLIVLVSICFIKPIFSQSQSFKIGYLLDKSSVEIEGLLNELSNEISAVVGKDANIQFQEESLINNFDKNLALAHYNTLLNNDTDIIIAFWDSQ